MRTRSAISIEAQKKAKPASADAASSDAATIDDIGSSDLHIKFRPNPLFFTPPIVENISFSKVGHTFGPGPALPGMPQTYAVQDFLFDQSGTSGTDGQVSITKTFDLATTTSYRVNIYPKDRSKRIKVVPPNSTHVSAIMDLGRQYVNAVSNPIDSYIPNSVFVNVLGPQPIFSNNTFYKTHSLNHWVSFFISVDIASAFSFARFTTIGIFPQPMFNAGLKSYFATSWSVPFNLPGPNPVPYFMFAYSTTSATDPGPFVFLE